MYNHAATEGVGSAVSVVKKQIIGEKCHTDYFTYMPRCNPLFNLTAYGRSCVLDGMINYTKLHINEFRFSFVMWNRNLPFLCEHSIESVVLQHVI